MGSKQKYDKGHIRRAYQSEGERQIARFLKREGIEFQYEHPLAVMDRGRLRLWYPDFRLREYGMIIEYFGMNGDAGYNDRARHKMEVYGQNGVEGLFLTEQSFKGDWPARILGELEDILKGRLNRFYRRKRRF